MLVHVGRGRCRSNFGYRTQMCLRVESEKAAALKGFEPVASAGWASIPVEKNE